MTYRQIVGQNELARLHILKRFVDCDDFLSFILAQDSDLSFCVVNLRNQINTYLACQFQRITELVSIFVVRQFALELPATDCNARRFIALLSKIGLKDACRGLDVGTCQLCVLGQSWATLSRSLPKRLLTLIKVKEHHGVTGGHHVSPAFLVAFDHPRSHEIRLFRCQGCNFYCDAACIVVHLLSVFSFLHYAAAEKCPIDISRFSEHWHDWNVTSDALNFLKHLQRS